MTRGLILAAPASGSGKTTLTLALLRCLRNRGVAVASAKVGPDYIDPVFHAAASGRDCRTLDGWAMRRETLAAEVEAAGRDCELLLVEGVMGLFDGAADGRGSTADLALATGWPLVLVVDARGMAASAAALLHGFATYDPSVRPAAVIFNRVGGERHAAMLTAACAPLGIPILGFLPRQSHLILPSRHLGLVQAGEHPDLEAFLEGAAGLVGEHLDLGALQALARPAELRWGGDTAPPAIPPLGQRIAVARDQAFAFAYPFQLEGWRRAGAEVSFFSPLADEGPDEAADAVFLPGGYPELQAGRLAGNERFLGGLRAAAERGATLYGECGGYMVLGKGLVDGEGTRHAMAGLLPVETSIASPRRRLGYRQAVLEAELPIGSRGAAFRAHEFHFALPEGAEPGPPLFACRDAAGNAVGPAGCREGRVFGSFLHLIDRV